MAILLALALSAVMAEPVANDVSVDPAALRLDGPTSRYSILVEGKGPDGSPIDLTRSAHYRSLAPAVATVDARGVVRPTGDGRATIEVEAAGTLRTVEVVAEGTARPRSFHFENDVVPILGKLGCNASGCHGKAEGQNGFKLSVFGSDPALDFAALTKEGRGRRIFPAAPGRSLLLAKVSGDAPHGGGVRARRGSADYETLLGWIAAGTPFGDPDAPKVVSIRVEPSSRVLAMRGTQQLRVIARHSDGREGDVTAYARFQSNNEGLAAVDEGGLVVAGESPGDVAVMAAYMGSVDVFRAIVPRPRSESGTLADASGVADDVKGPIDLAVDRKLRRLNIEPSGPCSDEDFLRRAYLDVIGTLPTPAEARRFRADPSVDRRARWIDDLLQRPEYADYWALQWADLLRIDRDKLGHKRAFAFYRWVRDRVADGTPLDRLAREVITAEGPLDEVGPANFFKVASKPGEAAGAVAQVFLGVRIACAECHHHPYDRWGQDDYYGMQAIFAPLAVAPGLGGEALLASGQATATNPRSGSKIAPRPLGAGAVSTEADPRIALASWLASADNPYFARHMANRYWAHFLGRGLVEPVDDVRDTNPPTNPELLDALAKILVDAKFDARALIRAITASATYQRSSRPNATNGEDEQNFSRARLRRVEAEVLLDMVCQATGVPEKFAGVPPGSRAIQLWDSKVPHYFLRIFGRPNRVTSCQCERGSEPGAGQVLHLLNSPEIHAKLTHEAGTVARLVRQHAEDGPLIEELYLTFFGRVPTAEERSAAVEDLARDPGRRREAAEDLAWGLLNSLEFSFNH